MRTKIAFNGDPNVTNVSHPRRLHYKLSFWVDDDCTENLAYDAQHIEISGFMYKSGYKYTTFFAHI